MKINENISLHGEKVILIPYKKEHVPKYHRWMKSEELLEKTASEPLSLEEEYEMQHSWWLDEDKCTFIIVAKHLYKENQNKKINEETILNNDSECISELNNCNEIDSMIGDVNLFFNNNEDKTEAELEIMIAEPSMRGLGMGKEAINIMMHYGYKELNCKSFVVKIGENNIESLGLFKKLGFVEVNYSKVFKETTLKLSVDDNSFQENIIKMSDVKKKHIFKKKIFF